MNTYDSRVQYVTAYFAEPTGLLVSIAGSHCMEPGWYCVEQGGEPCKQSDGRITPPAARFFGPFDTPAAAMKDALLRFS